MRVQQEIERLKTWPSDEPVFILRGQDVLAPEVVRHWAKLAWDADVCPSRKVAEAEKWANEMERWQPRKKPD